MRMNASVTDEAINQYLPETRQQARVLFGIYPNIGSFSEFTEEDIALGAATRMVMTSSAKKPSAGMAVRWEFTDRSRKFYGRHRLYPPYHEFFIRFSKAFETKHDLLQVPVHDDPVDNVEALEMLREVGRWLGGLEQRKRQMFVMYYFQPYRMKAVGAALGISESRVCQLLKALSELLKEHLHLCGYEF